MKKTRFALFQSIVALILCVSMLTGTTFAWFNDSVSSTNNLIASGILDVELEYLVDGEWVPVTKETEVLDKNALWEPGYTEVAYLKVRNEGNLALKYAFGVGILKEIGSINSAGQKFFLSDYIKFGVIESDTQPNFSTREDARKALTSSNLIVNGYSSENELPLYPKNNADNLPNERYVTLVVYIPEEVGNAANYATGATIPEIELGIQLMATQAEYESDSFGTDYDKNAKRDDFYFPVERIEISSSAGVDAGSDNKVANAVILEKDQARAVIPEGVLLYQDTNLLTLEVRSMDATGSNVTLEETEVIRSLDVHVIGVSKDNTVPMEITIKEAAAKGLNSTSIKLYHVENGETKKMDAVDTFTAHNQFKYDPTTGDITLYMATFSEVALVADTENAWEGEFDYTWYDADSKELTIANADQLAAFGAIVGGMAEGIKQDSFSGKTVKLIADVNLGDKESENNPDLIFHPIGYYYNGDSTAPSSTVYSFAGTFDGNGHTIANFYQNTWEIKGDYDGNYYKDAMGLFGRVYKGTVKNLTVKNFSSDGEYTTTGCIAAYADGATFENISIFNCNPRVYNIGNGGIVGCVGWYAKEAGLTTTFKNITVDNSNKISALWGSYDVACGGIVGQYYPTSGQSSAGTPANGGVHFENCHIAAQMDVYNDVCGNYQYYAYRYAGMLIGSVRENVTIDGHVYPKMDGITAEGCTVHFGTWNDYYYCEFEKNGHPSYSGPDDYKFSRVDKGELTIKADGTIECNHPNYTHTNVEDNRAIYLPFNNLVTGYGWGVTTKVVGELEGVTILDREVADSVEKFAKADTAKDSYESDVPVTIGELFKAAEISDLKLSIKAGQVQVTVSPVGDDSTAGGIYKANTNDWTQGTLTFSGVGTAQITITDYYFCTPTTITVNVIERTAAQKFEVAFDHDAKEEGKQNHVDEYLYRVGNQNAVKLDSLFAAAAKVDENDNKLFDENGKEITHSINSSGVSVEITKVSGNANVIYNANVSEWEKGTIQFSGTGVVKVTITDKDYCIPTELLLEVVDAYNVTTYSELKDQNSVLLNDIEMTQNGTYRLTGNKVLYGNGFTFDVRKGAYTGVEYDYASYVIYLENSRFDNVVIVGAVYPEVGAYKTDDYNRAIVMTNGDCSIVNSDISNGASPIRNGGDLELVNTTLRGGAYANLDLRNGHLILDNVTTINQVNKNDKYHEGGTDEKVIVGMGIVVYQEGGTEELKITIRNNLTQYNYLSKAQADLYFTDTYSNAIKGIVFGNQFTDYQNNGLINFGIISMNNYFGAEDLVDERKDNGGYFGTATKVTITGQSRNCYVYSVKPLITEVPLPDEPEMAGQGVIAPNAVFDFTDKNYQPKEEGSNDYCYADAGVVYISMDEGDTFNWDTSILKVTKNNQELTYTVSMNGTDYTGKSIAFSQSGEYEVVYKYTDPYNYDADGSTSGKTYEKQLAIYVSVVKAAAKHAEFSFGANGTAYSAKVVTLGDKTYVMPDVTATVSGKIGSKTVNGTTVYYPITEMYTSDGKTEHTGSWYACFPIFKNAVQIKDYADKGTGDSVIYNQTTVTKVDQIPSTLKAVDPKTAFLYSMNATNYPPPTDPTAVSGAVCYTCNRNGLTSSNTRKEENTVAEYTYKDNAGTVYYFYIGYHCAEQTSGSPCVTPDTLITLADGKQVRVDSLTGSEELLVWNLKTGKYDTAPIVFVDNDAEDTYEIIHLYFSDGSDVKVISEHGFFDLDLGEYVYIDADNYADYIGHRFVTEGDIKANNWNVVTLDEVVIETEVTTAWSPVTFEHLCYYTNGVLSMPGGIEGLFNIFEVDTDLMRYDAAKMQKDIETYGLFTIEDFGGMITEDAFDAFNGAYLKVAIAKGILTWEDIAYMAERYIPLM